MSETVDTKTVNRRMILLLAMATLSVPVWVLIQRNDNHLSDTANIWVGWISAAAMTALLLFLTYRRRPAGSRGIPRSMIVISLALLVLSGLITTVGIKASPSDNYLEVALSNVPLDKIHPERKRLMVELIRRNAANSADNDRIAKTIKPLSPSLYSADSFASKASMESTASQLKQEYDIDQSYAAAKHQAMQDFYNKMQKADPAYLRDFQSSMKNDDDLEASIGAAEAKWITTTLNLYDYAIAHASEISTNTGGHLVIANPEVRQSLVQQINACTTLQQTMMDIRTKAVDKQHRLQDAAGIKHSD